MLRAPWIINITAVFAILASSAVTIAEQIYPDPAVNLPHTESIDQKPANTAPLRPMDITVPGAQPPTEADTFFYKYQGNISFDVGPYISFDQSYDVLMYGLLGVHYLWYSPYLVHFETGIEEISSSEGHVWTDLRFQSNATHKWRPFWGAGLGLRLMPQNGLATVLQLSDYFARASIGAELGIDERASWTMEAAAACDFQGHPFVTLTWGYAFGI